MDNREPIAAILTAGMLPTLEIPQSRARGKSGPVTGPEGEPIQRAVDDAFGLYRLFLNRPAAGVTPAPERSRGQRPAG
jgi:hypothetical protein